MVKMRISSSIRIGDWGGIGTAETAQIQTIAKTLANRRTMPGMIAFLT